MIFLEKKNKITGGFQWIIPLVTNDQIAEKIKQKNL